MVIRFNNNVQVMAKVTLQDSILVLADGDSVSIWVECNSVDDTFTNDVVNWLAVKYRDLYHIKAVEVSCNGLSCSITEYHEEEIDFDMVPDWARPYAQKTVIKSTDFYLRNQNPCRDLIHDLKKNGHISFHVHELFKHMDMDMICPRLNFEILEEVKPSYSGSNSELPFDLPF